MILFHHLGLIFSCAGHATSMVRTGLGSIGACCGSFLQARGTMRHQQIMLSFPVCHNSNIFMRFTIFHFNCYLNYQIKILQNRKQIMEDFTNKRISIETKLKVVNPNLSHHTSLQYGATFFSKNPIYRRNTSSQVIKIENINKEEIFGLVYQFVGKLVTNSAYVQDILKNMMFQKQDKTISVTKITASNSQKQNSDKSFASSGIISGQLKDSMDNIEIQPAKALLQVPKKQKKKQNRQPKISIMVGSFSDFSSDSRLSGKSLNISSINFPPHVLTIDMIRKIFQEPEPFLINLAMCLMMKFLHYSKMPVSCANACWIIGISTIIAYKIYYDEPVGGLIESFANVLEISGSQIMDLQMYFLDQISFQAVITSEQYHVMLSKIVNP